MEMTENPEEQVSVDLPEEIIPEILCRLPVKSLVQFIIVCKTWQSLIESSHFISNHLKQNSKSSSSHLVVSENDFGKEYTVSLCSSEDPPVYLLFPLLGEGTYLEIIGISYGLFCILSRTIDGLCEIFVYNPSTRRFCSILKDDDWRPLVGEDIALGFTFDPCFSDYKLIKLKFSFEQHSRRKLDQAWIYTLDTSCWREINIPAHIGAGLMVESESYAVTVGTKFYWSCSQDPSCKRVILCFDMSDESFELISVPREFNCWGHTYTKFRVSQPKKELAISEITTQGVLTVWTLDADSISWCMIFSIDLVPLIATIVEVKDDSLRFIRVRRRRDGVLVVVVDEFQCDTDCDLKLFLYDLGSREITSIPLCEHGYNVYDYTESLLPVKKMGQV